MQPNRLHLPIFAKIRRKTKGTGVELFGTNYLKEQKGTGVELFITLVGMMENKIDSGTFDLRVVFAMDGDVWFLGHERRVRRE